MPYQQNNSKTRSLSLVLIFEISWLVPPMMAVRLDRFSTEHCRFGLQQTKTAPALPIGCFLNHCHLAATG
jgi:hypothetical protein